MRALTITVGSRAFQFISFSDWVNHAKGRFEEAYRKGLLSPTKAVCVDAKGRLCFSGAEFERAHHERAFPISVYDGRLIPCTDMPFDQTADGEEAA